MRRVAMRPLFRRDAAVFDDDNRYHSSAALRCCLQWPISVKPQCGLSFGFSWLWDDPGDLTTIFYIDTLSSLRSGHNLTYDKPASRLSIHEAGLIMNL